MDDTQQNNADANAQTTNKPKAKPCKFCLGTARVRGQSPAGIIDVPCVKCGGTGLHAKLTIDEHRQRKKVTFFNPGPSREESGVGCE